MQFHQPSNQSEADPQATLSVLGVRIQLSEHFEDLVELLGGSRRRCP